MSRQFEIFEITPNSEKLRTFRNSFVHTIERPTLYKILSSSPNWFYYRRGVYDVREQLGGSFFQFAMVPVKEDTKTIKEAFNDFVKNGCVSTEHVKGIRYEENDRFIFSASVLMSKRGRNYNLNPVIPVSEDIYNLSKVEFGDFLAITTQDLSQYSEFFTVSDKPKLVISRNRIRENYENGLISYPEYLERIAKLDKEEKLVKTLRQGKSTK